MKISANVSGTWHDLSALHAKVSGSWQAIQNGYVKVSGSWQQFYSAGPPPPPPFSPHTDTIMPSASGNQTVPSGAAHLVITVYGPGARGDSATDEDGLWFDGKGGDGGGKAVKTVAIAESDWGVNLAYASLNSGEGNCTVSGTLVAGSISIIVGTSASGGDSNTNGNPGSGGHVAEGSGGSGGDGLDDAGNNGGGGAVGEMFANGSFGGGGLILFAWT